MSSFVAKAITFGMTMQVILLSKILKQTTIPTQTALYFYFINKQYTYEP